MLPQQFFRTTGVSPKIVPVAAALSDWVYGMEKQIAKFNDKVEVLMGISSDPSEGQLTSVALVLHREYRTLFVVWKGTSDTWDVLQDMNAFAQQSHPPLGHWCHSGMLNMVMRDFSSHLERVSQIGQDYSAQIDHVVFTGHSLGGGIAAVAMAEIKLSTRIQGSWKLPSALAEHKLCAVTFAAPMVFHAGPHQAAQNYVEDLVKAHHLNFVYGNDIVPRLPSLAFMLNTHKATLAQLTADQLPRYAVVRKWAAKCTVLQLVESVVAKMETCLDFQKYQHVCCLVLLKPGVAPKVEADSDDMREFHEDLEEQNTGSMVLNHKMRNYLNAVTEDLVLHSLSKTDQECFSRGLEQSMQEQSTSETYQQILEQSAKLHLPCSHLLNFIAQKDTGSVRRDSTEVGRGQWSARGLLNTHVIHETTQLVVRTVLDEIKSKDDGHVFFLLGATGSGKSTFANWMLEKKMKVVEPEELDEGNIIADAVVITDEADSDIKIGHDAANAMTFIPNVQCQDVVVERRPRRSEWDEIYGGPPNRRRHKTFRIIVVDWCGLFDTKSVAIRIAMDLAFRQVWDRVQMKKLAIGLLDLTAMRSTRGQVIWDTVKKVHQLLPPEKVQTTWGLTKGGEDFMKRPEKVKELVHKEARMKYGQKMVDQMFDVNDMMFGRGDKRGDFHYMFDKRSCCGSVGELGGEIDLDCLDGDAASTCLRPFQDSEFQNELVHKYRLIAEGEDPLVVDDFVREYKAGLDQTQKAQLEQTPKENHSDMGKDVDGALSATSSELEVDTWTLDVDKLDKLTRSLKALQKHAEMLKKAVADLRDNNTLKIESVYPDSVGALLGYKQPRISWEFCEVEMTLMQKEVVETGNRFKELETWITWACAANLLDDDGIQEVKSAIDGARQKMQQLAKDHGFDGLDQRLQLGNAQGHGLGRMFPDCLSAIISSIFENIFGPKQREQTAVETDPFGDCLSPELKLSEQIQPLLVPNVQSERETEIKSLRPVTKAILIKFGRTIALTHIEASKYGSLLGRMSSKLKASFVEKEDR